MVTIKWKSENKEYIDVGRQFLERGMIHYFRREDGSEFRLHQNQIISITEHDHWWEVEANENQL